MINIDKAFYVGTHYYSFRSGEPAEILEVVTFSDDELPLLPRVCYHIKYLDGKEDWCPVSDGSNYKILTSEQVKESYKESNA